MNKDQLKLADVAKRAGVAVSTVSRVVNGSSLVSTELRQRIELIIETMGYKPVPMEKRKGVRKEQWPWLKHRMLKTVIFGPYDLFWITNYAPIYAYALHGVEEQVGHFQLRRAVDRAETSRALIDVLERGDADGSLILNTGTQPLPTEIASYPVVVFMGTHPDLACDRVIPNSRRAGNLAAEYLLKKGCRSGIAIGGESAVYRERTDSFRARLADQGIESAEIHQPAIIRGGAHVHQANRAVVSKELLPLLRKMPRPFGIFSIMDIVTPAVYAELATAGLKIGTDVHVVSCNNERPYLDQLQPQPAVIDTRADYIGRRAVRQLMQRLEFPATPHEKVQIEPQLIEPELA